MKLEKCSACGSEVEHGSFVCSSCGTLVRDLSESSEVAPETSKGRRAHRRSSERRSRERNENNSQSIKKSHIFYILTAACITVLIVVMAMSSKTRNTSQKKSSTRNQAGSSVGASQRLKIEKALTSIKRPENLSSPGRDYYILPHLSEVDVMLSVAAVLVTGKPTLDAQGKGRISLKPISDPYAPILADIFYKDGKPFKVLIPKNLDRIKQFTGSELEVISKFNYSYDKDRDSMEPEEIDELRRSITEDAGYDYDTEVGSGFWRACYESELWREEHPLSVFFGLVKKK